MPKVDLTATKDFTYMTRRLTAGDPFQARNPLEARILTRVRKVAEEPSSTVDTETDGPITQFDVFDVPQPEAIKGVKRAAPKKAPAKRKAKAKK